MFNINQIYKIENFLDDTEVAGFDYYCDHYVWNFAGVTDSGENVKMFWNKDLWQSKWGKCIQIESTFRDKIENLLNIKVETKRLYLNGQAHGQCGGMHSDITDDEYDPNYNYITAIYYTNENWKPEYGGFTIIIDKQDNMHTIYPKFNSIVIFDSSLDHVGLEPTSHCSGQRVTLAHKMKILKES